MFDLPKPTPLNHHPAIINVWIPYNRGRYKDCYDLIAHDGTYYQNYRPNGNSWYRAMLPEGMSRENNVPKLDDSEVKYIRLTPDNRLGSGLRGNSRVLDNAKLFSPWLPEVEGFQILDRWIVRANGNIEHPAFKDNETQTYYIFMPTPAGGYHPVNKDTYKCYLAGGDVLEYILNTDDTVVLDIDTVVTTCKMLDLNVSRP